jgi:hypothetical protein
VPVELVVTAGDLPELEFPLLLPQRPLDPGVVVFGVPGAEGLRMDAVDHQVHVAVHRVSMGDDQHLVLPEAQIGEEPVRDLVHLRGVHRIRGIEGESQVVDRPLDTRRLRGCGAHQ